MEDVALTGEEVLAVPPRAYAVELLGAEPPRRIEIFEVLELVREKTRRPVELDLLVLTKLSPFRGCAIEDRLGLTWICGHNSAIN